MLERLDLGITVKNDFISPVVSYQLQDHSALEFTLPYNFKLTPGTWVEEPGLQSFYGAIKYVNPWTIGTQTLDIYPMLIALNSNAYGPNGLSDPLALGLGIGKSFRSRGWSIRPELELHSFANGSYRQQGHLLNTITQPGHPSESRSSIESSIQKQKAARKTPAAFLFTSPTNAQAFQPSSLQALPPKPKTT